MNNPKYAFKNYLKLKNARKLANKKYNSMIKLAEIIIK